MSSKISPQVLGFCALAFPLLVVSTAIEAQEMEECAVQVVPDMQRVLCGQCLSFHLGHRRDCASSLSSEILFMSWLLALSPTPPR